MRRVIPHPGLSVLLALVWLGVYTAKILMASFVFVTRGAKMPTYGTS